MRKAIPNTQFSCNMQHRRNTHMKKKAYTRYKIQSQEHAHSAIAMICSFHTSIILIHSATQTNVNQYRPLRYDSSHAQRAELDRVHASVELDRISKGLRSVACPHQLSLVRLELIQQQHRQLAHKLPQKACLRLCRRQYILVQEGDEIPQRRHGGIPT